MRRARIREDVPLAAEEFNTLFVGKTAEWVVDGKRFDGQLIEGGKSIISNNYNDVGRWRPLGGGYCNIWNKRPMSEFCVSIVRRDGKLTAIRPDGSVSGVIEAIR